MNFRNMAKEMTNTEIECIVKEVFPYTIVSNITRHIESNYISVDYYLESKKYTIDLLPDDIYMLGVGKLPDGEPMKSGERLWRYRQFMIANYYSEIWYDNPYVKS